MGSPASRLVRTIEEGTTATSLRRALVDRVREAADADVALFYSLRETEHGPRIASGVSNHPTLADGLLVLERSAGLAQNLPDVRRAPAREVRGFVDASARFGSWGAFVEVFAAHSSANTLGVAGGSTAQMTWVAPAP
jgi:hypothetical protein